MNIQDGRLLEQVLMNFQTNITLLICIRFLKKKKKQTKKKKKKKRTILLRKVSSFI